MTLIDPEDLGKVSDEDLWDLYTAIQEGAQTPAEGLGLDEPVLNSVERMALGYYRARRFEMAAPIYGFLLQMNPARASAWRGLGACAQSMKRYEVAKACYGNALRMAPEDAVSAVFYGETLCFLGETEKGLKVLGEAVSRFDGDAAAEPYLVRARAIIAAEGGALRPVILRRHGEALLRTAESSGDSEQAALGRVFEEASSEALMAYRGQTFDPDREITFEDMKKNPELMRALGELREAVGKGQLTLAEVGGFTEEELKGAYACACKYADMGQLGEALQITGYLIFISPNHAEYYQLGGICMQRMGRFDVADQYYRLALALNAQDPMTLIYQGEAQIMSGNIDQGLETVTQGLEIAKENPEATQPLIDRAKVLVQQFSSAGQV